METRNLEEENEQLKIKLSQANAARQHIEEKLVNLLSRDGNYMATRLLAAEKAILNQRFELARLNKALAKKRRATDVLRIEAAAAARVLMQDGRVRHDVLRATEKPTFG